MVAFPVAGLAEHIHPAWGETLAKSLPDEAAGVKSALINEYKWKPEHAEAAINLPMEIADSEKANTDLENLSHNEKDTYFDSLNKSSGTMTPTQAHENAMYDVKNKQPDYGVPDEEQPDDSGYQAYVNKTFGEDAEPAPKKGVLKWPLHEKTLADSWNTKNELKALDDKVALGIPLHQDEYQILFDTILQESGNGNISPQNLDTALEKLSHATVDNLKDASSTPPKGWSSTDSIEEPFSSSSKIQPIDISGYQKVGDQLGSNPGGTFQSPEGLKTYAKFPENEQQARSEAAAAEIYHRIGAETVSPTLVKGPDGKIGVGSSWQENLKEVDPSQPVHPDDYRDLAKQFVAAVLTKNWDAVGIGSPYNLVKDSTGNVLNVDLGGAFKFRAQGEPKDFGPDIDEHESLLQHESAKSIFGQIPKEYIGEAVRGLKNLNVGQLQDIFRKYGVEDPNGHAAALDARIQELNTLYPYAKGDKPSWMSYERQKTTDIEPPIDFYKGLSDAELFSMEQYTGSSYTTINAYLRGNKDYIEERVPVILPLIKHLQRAIASAPPLTEPVVLYRGISNYTWDAIFQHTEAGDIVDDKGFLSTSVSKSVAHDFGEAKIIIEAPAGSKALVMGPAGLQHEKEVLLPPSAKIEVISIDRKTKEVRARYVSQG